MTATPVLRACGVSLVCVGLYFGLHIALMPLCVLGAGLAMLFLV